MSDDAKDDLGPEKTSDDATVADMGLGGTPATSATPVGQGEESGTGAEEDDRDGDGADADE